LNADNILINSDTLEVKLIDFDLTHKVGTSYIAYGSSFFVTDKFMEMISKKMYVEAAIENDLFALAVCCFLLLVGKLNLTGELLQNNSVNTNERDKMVDSTHYWRKDVV